MGIPYFPDRIADEPSADDTFKKALAGAEISDAEYLWFIGNMYLFLAAEYKKRNLVMQMHLAVYRNANSNLFAALGADCGVDCVGDEISGTALIHMLDAINKNSGMPQTVIYTLNTANAAQIPLVPERALRRGLVVLRPQARHTRGNGNYSRKFVARLVPRYAYRFAQLSILRAARLFPQNCGGYFGRLGKRRRI